MARSNVAQADVANGLSDFANGASETLESYWQQAVVNSVVARRDDVVGRLDSVVGTATVEAKKPAWWSAGAWLQKGLFGIAVAGALWLLAVVVAQATLRIDTDVFLPATPEIDWLPLPSALLVGGLLIGAACGWISMIAAGISARRRVRATKKQLNADTEQFVIAEIVEPTKAIIDKRNDVADLLIGAGFTR